MSTTAIILAAGQGKRLLPLTRDLPKCLLKVGELSILEHQIHALRRAGVSRFIIVSGFERRALEDLVAKALPGLPIELVFNDAYATSQNIISLAAAIPHISSAERVLEINGDVMCDEHVFADMVAGNPDRSVSAIRRGKMGEEEMKVRVRSDGTIDRMDKGVSLEETWGEAFGLHLFAPRFWQALATNLDTMRHTHREHYFEHAIERTCAREPLYPHDIGSARALEIDFPEDLIEARKIFS